MSNQRFRSDFESNQNMGRRFRGRYGNHLRTKWERKPQNDVSVTFNTDRNYRQIRSNKDDNNNFDSVARRGGERNDRALNNWSSKGGRGVRYRQFSHNRNQRRNLQSYSDITSERNKDDIDSQWFKIMIPHGHKIDKQMVLQLIHDSTQLAFTPYNYHNERDGVVFFVLGGETADALRAISRKITTPSGHKMIVMVQRSAIPPTPINDELTNTIKLVMSQRFDVNTNIMDLSKFREDPSLQQLGLYVPLSRPNMLNTVIKIIVENTPQIVGLNMRDNKIASLEPMVQLGSECRQLRAIDLSQNQIRNTTELDNIKALELIELHLEGNPVCETFEDQANYISCIRSRFPKLTKLDGEELPASIGFDVQEVSNLPLTKPGHLPEHIQTFIHGFFEAYYNIYDSDDRQGLIQAYHDQALFSFSISRQDNSSHKFADRLIQESRNLIRIKDYTQRNKLIKNGKIAIVSALCELPRTRHQPQSFEIDVPLCTNSFVLVVVNGVYREIYKKQEPLRAFCRTFYIVPQGQGFVIVNDVLLLTNATVKQIQTYGKSKTTASTSSDRQMTEVMDSRLGPMIPELSPIVGRSSLNARNDELIQRFMSATHMNRSFAQQCLEENAYDMDKAFNVFQTLKSSNAIPSAAFH